jgi:hypothetical protein
MLDGTRGSVMSLCAMCGTPLSTDAGLCPYHHSMSGGDWAIGNRIMCDLLHRGVVPRRLTAAERLDDLVLPFDTVQPTLAGRS